MLHHFFLLQGESLFNDGTAIFGYTVLLEVVTAQFNGGFWDILLLFITTFGVLAWYRVLVLFQ